jgi:hypothetical protein
MEKEFVPYELAVSLKALGFDELCSGHYSNGELIHSSHTNNQMQRFRYSAPTFSQAFRWFREKYNIYAIILPSYADDKVVKDRFFYEIANGRKLNQELNYHNTYEEAELACLNKLIEIIESKPE